MIEIKGRYGDWHQVDKNTAKEYTTFLKTRLESDMTEEEKNQYINTERLRGTTIEELEKWEGEDHGD